MVQVNNSLRPVYIVDGSRTPLLKVSGRPGPFTAADLAVATGSALLLRQPFAPNALDEVVMGCVIPSVNEANIGRIVSLRLGCGNAVTAWTVQRNCASGLQAIDSAAQNIAVGRTELSLAGGTEAMSHSPLLWPDTFVNWLADWRQAKTPMQKAKVLAKIRPNYFTPVIGLLNGLRDPVVGLSMGQTAENLAYQFNITRLQMDEFALRSHQRLLKAQEENHLSEITPIFSGDGQYFDRDNGVRPDSSLEKLAKLPPFFDPPYGQVTAGNSSQITDGAATLILASEDAIKKYKLPVLARLHNIAWAGVDPAFMGIGPAHAISRLLLDSGKTINDIDYWEINEAFAAQVLACVIALNDKKYCQENLGLSEPVGLIPQDRLDIDGGAIACGHPLGATGARLTLHVARTLQRTGKRFGVASMCIGGGQGGAVLIERV
jgi:acetyl-CoA C-acetyltransferase